jgi:hypothetical protein
MSATPLFYVTDFTSWYVNYVVGRVTFLLPEERINGGGLCFQFLFGKQHP